jgi:hypothetical protein
MTAILQELCLMIDPLDRWIFGIAIIFAILSAGPLYGNRES